MTVLHSSRSCRTWVCPPIIWKSRPLLFLAFGTCRTRCCLSVCSLHVYSSHVARMIIHFDHSFWRPGSTNNQSIGGAWPDRQNCSFCTPGHQVCNVCFFIRMHFICACYHTHFICDCCYFDSCCDRVPARAHLASNCANNADNNSSSPGMWTKNSN